MRSLKYSTLRSSRRSSLQDGRPSYRTLFKLLPPYSLDPNPCPLSPQICPSTSTKEEQWLRSRFAAGHHHAGTPCLCPPRGASPGGLVQHAQRLLRPTAKHHLVKVLLVTPGVKNHYRPLPTAAVAAPHHPVHSHTCGEGSRKGVRNGYGF
jgi:hypothetical protein